jgi:hypothetical protein
MQHLSRHKYKYFGIFGSIGAAVSLHYYTHLETSPITGRRRYMMMNVDQLVTLSEMEKEKVRLIRDRFLLLDLREFRLQICFQIK